MTIAEKYLPILFITALPFESKIILNHHNTNFKPKKLTTYQLEESIYLIEVPVGFKSDLSILNRHILQIRLGEEKLSPKLLINFGICGALDSTIPIGLPFHIKKVYHFNKKLLEVNLPEIVNLFQPASLLTVDEPVLEAKRRNDIYSRTGCQLVDMEAFNIARFCREQNLPLCIVKVSSDLADEDSLKVIKANRSKLKKALANAYKKMLSNSFQ